MSQPPHRPTGLPFTRTEYGLRPKLWTKEIWCTPTLRREEAFCASKKTNENEKDAQADVEAEKKNNSECDQHKKMDTLMTVSNGGTHVVQMQPGKTASGVSATLWSPTALMLASPNVSSTSSRNAHSVFWRGVQENVSLKTDISDPFAWRRIVVELDTLPRMVLLALPSTCRGPVSRSSAEFPLSLVLG